MRKTSKSLLLVAFYLFYTRRKNGAGIFAAAIFLCNNVYRDAAVFYRDAVF